MSVPAWILWAFAAIMLVVAGVGAARAAVRLARWRRGGSAAGGDIDGAHVLMGVAMAGMLVTGLRTLPAGAWEMVFAVLAGWFGRRVAAESRSGLAWWRGGHYLPHLVHSVAMLYAFLALTPAGSGSVSPMARMGAGPAAIGTLRLPTLAFGFAVVLAVFAIWDLDQVSGALERGARRAAAGRGGACEATLGRVAMGVTMAFMLVIML
jgi:hypothetical protein